MNYVFKVVWNDALQAWLAVNELGGSAHKKAKSQKTCGRWRVSVVALAAGMSGYASAQLPTGGAITAGSGSIAVNGSTMTINQTTQRMVTDWQSFSVGAGKTVEFIQPSSTAAALNRVLGADVSTIQGAIRANGQVFLLNPNGVLFSPTAQVNVGSLVASTLNLSDQNFMAGKLNFEGASANAVVNQGSLRATQGGTVALVAARIVNEPGAGIVADGGQVLMGAGSKVTLDLGGPVRIKVDEAALHALIEQGGAVQADGGLVYMTAKSASVLSGTVINHTGVTRAQTVSTGAKGEIYLMGGMDKDSVQVAGTLDASAPNGGNGGFIETSAANVNIADGVNITTAAAVGTTGQWLIDPVDFIVKSSGGNITGSALSTLLNSNSVTIQTVMGTDTSTNTSTNLYTSVSGSGDIFILDNITKASGSASILTLLADRNIEIGSSTQAVTIRGSASSPLSLVLSARATGAAAGHVDIQRTTIKTYGGDITIGGGDASASGYAIAQRYVHDAAAGVQISYDSLIDASSDAGAAVGSYSNWTGSRQYFSAGSSSNTGGNIAIRGQGSSTALTNGSSEVQPNLGVWMWKGASISTAGNGTITLDGTGGNGNVSTFGRVASVGVLLESRSNLIAKDGDISIQGRAGIGYDVYGVGFTEGGGLIKTGGKLLINTADTTPANANDNAILIRDGNTTFDVGGVSEFRAPLVGGTDNSRISSVYSFTTVGTGSLTLYGDAVAWNASRPSNTSVARYAGRFDVTGGDLLAATGLTQRQVLYSFLPPELVTGDSGSFKYSVGTIAGNTLSPSGNAQPLRLTPTREDQIARGIVPRNATPEERAQAESQRYRMIDAGIVPPGATDNERLFAESRRKDKERLMSEGFDLSKVYGVIFTPEEIQQAKENRMALIAQGRYAPWSSSEEKKQIAANRKKRDDMIARGETPPNATDIELANVRQSRDRLVSEGAMVPNATPAERDAAAKVRTDKINRGIVPPNATSAERFVAGAKNVGNAFRRLFGR